MFWHCSNCSSGLVSNQSTEFLAVTAMEVAAKLKINGELTMIQIEDRRIYSCRNINLHRTIAWAFQSMVLRMFHP